MAVTLTGPTSSVTYKLDSYFVLFDESDT